MPDLSAAKVSQAEFRAAMLDPARPAPGGLLDGHGAGAGKRFDVYRNNVAVSLTEALETAFPVVRKLVGDAFFKAMAGVFLRAHPPSTPMMMHYGAAFPGFLETFEPARGLPYLSDIARLEQALRRSYHAADVTAVSAEALGRIPPEALETLRFSFAPAVEIIASPYPVVSIWRRNTGAAEAVAGTTAQCAMVTRPGFDPKVHLVPGPALRVLARLHAGETLGRAIEAAGEGFDLAALLGLILSEGAITEMTTGTPADHNEED